MNIVVVPLWNEGCDRGRWGTAGGNAGAYIGGDRVGKGWAGSGQRVCQGVSEVMVGRFSDRQVGRTCGPLRGQNKHCLAQQA